MQRQKKKAAAATLAGVMILTGCARSTDVYTAGLRQEAQTEAEQESETLRMTEQWSESEESTEASSVIYVYVCGAVVNPGVYGFRDGTRVFEAIAQAGGFAQDADTQWLNQAEMVLDGQKLYIYTAEETAQMESERAAGCGSRTGSGEERSSASDSQADTMTTGGLINLNTAGREELMTLPGIGEAKADAILAYRAEHGSFSSIEEIRNISGIKSGVFSKIKDKITVT